MNGSWLRRIFAKGGSRSTGQDPIRGTWTPNPIFYVPSNLRLSNDEATTLSTVYRCVREITDPIASSDIRVHAHDARGRRVERPDDPIAYLLNVRPNQDVTAVAFWELMFWSAMTSYSGGWAEIVRDNGNRITGFNWLDPHRVRLVHRDPEDGKLKLLFNDFRNGDVTFDYDEVIHLRGPSTYSLLGDCLVTRAAAATALARAQEVFSQSYYANGGTPGAVLKSPKAPNKEEAERLKADWIARYGHGHEHAPAVLFGGMDIEFFETDAVKSALIPARQFSVEEIARFFGVPLVKLGVQAAAQGYGTNVEQLDLAFAKGTLTPWVKRLTQEIQAKCYPARAPWPEVTVDLHWYTEGDAKTRAEAREIRVRSAQLTPNEARAEAGRDPHPNGDVLLVDGKYLTLEALIEQAKNPPAPAAKPAAPAKPEGDEPPGPRRPAPAQRDAAARLLVAALDRHANRVKAKPDVRERLRPKALEEIRSVLELLGREGDPARAAETALASIEAGVDPSKAAQHLMA